MNMNRKAAGEMLELLRRRRGNGATVGELADYAGLGRTGNTVETLLARELTEGRVSRVMGSRSTVYVLSASEWDDKPTDEPPEPPVASWVPAGIGESRNAHAERDSFRRGYQAALKDMRAWLAKAGG